MKREGKRGRSEIREEEKKQGRERRERKQGRERERKGPWREGE